MIKIAPWNSRNPFHRIDVRLAMALNPLFALAGRAWMLCRDEANLRWRCKLTLVRKDW